jgi:hypothetical protein
VEKNFQQHQKNPSLLLLARSHGMHVFADALGEASGL